MSKALCLGRCLKPSSVSDSCQASVRGLTDCCETVGSVCDTSDLCEFALEAAL
jgi:hypothetical protein